MSTPITDHPILKPYEQDATVNVLALLRKRCHQAAARWWRNPATGEPIDRNKGECFALMHSELSEAFEGERKSLMDDRLPHRKSVEVELADLLIRVLDYAGKHNLDLGGALVEKLAFNATRADHRPEARLAAGGKQW